MGVANRFHLQYDVEDQQALHWKLTQWIIGLSPFVFSYLLLTSPTTYGKLHSSSATAAETARTSSNFSHHSWGPLLPGSVCWFIFECPPILWSVYGYLSRDDPVPNTSLPNILLLASFTIHYIYRSIIYTFCVMSRESKFPLGLMFFTIPYTFINGL